MEVKLLRLLKLITLLFFIFSLRCYGVEKRVLPEYLEQHGEFMAIEYELDWKLVKAVLFLESRWDIDCISHNYDEKGNIISTDKGIGQQNNQWLDWYGKLAKLDEPDPLNPIHSIKMCCAGLKYWKERAINYTDNEEKIIIYCLNFYNMGEKGFVNYIKKYNIINRAYSDKVLEFKAMLDEYGYILD